MLKLFSILIARLHSGRRHDETIGSSLVPIYYPLLHRTNKVSILRQLTSIILFGNSELIYTTRTKIFSMGTDSDFYNRYT